MIKEVKYSIIVPVYNVELYLSQCIESVINQTYSCFELILVDDGSTDSSGEICDKYKKSDERIVVIHKKNGGLSDARNYGIEAATGDRVIFLDADDYWMTNKALWFINENITGSNCLVAWRYEKCEENETIVETSDICKARAYELNKSYQQLFRTGKLVASACFIAVPIDWFHKNNMLFTKGDLSEDIEWFANVLIHAKDIVILDLPLYAYRQRRGSISHTFNLNTVLCVEKHLMYLAALAKGNPVIRTYLAEQIANYLIVLSRSEVTYKCFSDIQDAVLYFKYAARLRSRILFILYCLLGRNNTIKLLRVTEKLLFKD